MVPNDMMLQKMKVSLCCIYACNAYTNVAAMCVTDVVIGGGGRVGNLTVVEGCAFQENETSRLSSCTRDILTFILWTTWNNSC